MASVCSGNLLVAMPVLTDPNFDRTVVYIVDHGEHGTLGVVLNRPSDTDLLEVLPGWWSLAAPPRTFHVGGPCERNTALCLGVGNPPSGVPGLRPIAQPVHLVDLDADPAVTGAVLDRLRVFAGYAGWGPGQLADEIAEQAWAVVASQPSDVVGEARGGLWRSVLRRQGGSLAMLSAYTEDSSLN
ncbi:MAG: YqgE/AlgH family protein [Geodermatophilaceae bacterium]|nr:YqgE/AlgH family protein [Geodermatophilaceae bacterium]